ncbi:MAG TPA: hypothetical protein VH308_08835 [Terracidiphilus sp.]|jgi:hypothetical protein|nr:hypothetical protein [Terracidiphilus sp.]
MRRIAAIFLVAVLMAVVFEIWRYSMRHNAKTVAYVNDAINTVKRQTAT